jgi:hypothetical protein
MEPLEECQVFSEEVTPRRESSDSRTVRPDKRSSSAPVLPWERLAGESARAFDQFKMYCDLGPQRSIDATYHQSRPSAPAGRAPGPWFERASKNRWVERAQQYDNYLDEVERDERQLQRKELQRRRFKFALANQERLERRVAKMEANLDKADTAPITDVTVKKREGGIENTTKVKGINLSGYARMVKETNETAQLAAIDNTPVREGIPAPRDIGWIVPSEDQWRL